MRGNLYSNVLVRNDLDALDVAGGLEDLAQDVLGDARVQASHIQCAFVRLGGGAARDVARPSAGGRHDVCAHGRADGRRDGIRVLRDDDGCERRRGHVLLRLAGGAAVVARGAGRGRRGRHLRLCGCRVGHGNYSRKTRRGWRVAGGRGELCVRDRKASPTTPRLLLLGQCALVRWEEWAQWAQCKAEEGRRQGNKRTGRRDPKTPECGKERKRDRKRAGKTRSDTDAKGR